MNESASLPKRICLTVAYDGTRYCGWQIQKNGPSIEGELKAALERIIEEEVRLIGASRTDAGVHSLGNVAVFDTHSRIPAEKFCYALNQWLPEDIVVRRSQEVAPTWHPRKAYSKKTYEYRILNAQMPDPTRRLDTHFDCHRLDVGRMQRAAELLEGKHDFTSFSSVHRTVQTTVRTIYSAHVEKQGDLILIRICGNGFLYNMVRIIAGTLLEIGHGDRDPASVIHILAAKDRAAAGPTAPAKGLTMLGITYDEV